MGEYIKIVLTSNEFEVIYKYINQFFQTTYIIIIIAIETTTQYIREVLGTELGYMPDTKFKCGHSHRNKQCVGMKCRFFEIVKKGSNN